MLVTGQRGLQKIQQRLFIDLGNYRQTIFLAGTGRSGSTWVADLINYNNSYRMMFEPFYPEKIKLLKEWNARQYLRPENDETQFLQPATAILNGQIRHKWIDRFNHKILVKKRLIKDIRANLFLKWIKHHFPEIPLIFLLRHPCAVAHSKLQLGWKPPLYKCLIQPELIDDFLKPFQPEIAAAVDLFEQHIFMWCIDNYVPLKQFSPSEIHIIFYEKLCIEPEPEIKELLRFVGEAFSPNVFTLLPKPSALSQENSAIFSGTSLIDSWQQNLSDHQINRAIEILSLFGLQAIYAEQSRPLLKGKDCLTLFTQK